jgi:hypothetical protein
MNATIHAPEHTEHALYYVHGMRTSCALQVSLLFQRATVHDLESRRRSWEDAKEIVTESQKPATLVIAVCGAAQRLTARHGGGGDGVGDNDGDGDDGGDGDERNEADEGDEGDGMGVDDDTAVNAHRRAGLGDTMNHVDKNRRANTMTISEWVAALVRLAWRCFPQTSTIGTRLSTLLEDFVLPGTLQGLRAAGLTATPDRLKQHLDSKKVPRMCICACACACAY